MIKQHAGCFVVAAGDSGDQRCGVEQIVTAGGHDRLPSSALRTASTQRTWTQPAGLVILAMLWPTTIVMPLIAAYGIDPVHFGVVLVLNLTIGLLLPPVGLLMFIVCAIGEIGLYGPLSVWAMGEITFVSITPSSGKS